MREEAKMVHERKGRTVVVTQDHALTTSFVLCAVIKRATFDYKQLFI